MFFFEDVQQKPSGSIPKHIRATSRISDSWRLYLIKGMIIINKIIIDLYTMTDAHKQDSVVWNEPSSFPNAESVL